LPAFRTEYMGKNLGAFPQMLAYVDERMPLEKAASLSLIHDVLPRPSGGRGAAEIIAPYWEELCRFGSGEAVWHPYWEEDCPVKPETEHVYCSVYERNDGRLLAAVSSFNEETDEVVLRLPGGMKAGKPVPGVAQIKDSEGGLLRLSMKAFRPELIELIP
ncbi:MAG: hypothetical protein II953_01775, partial [Clostridia bacterium]|nr:hypothetical protein [Clostridia bacterium]